MGVAAIPLVLLVLSANDFQRVSEVDGILLESRPVPGSRFAEFQLTMVVRGNAGQLCRTAYGSGKIETWEPHLRQRLILKETNMERTTYEQVAPPLVSWRDYAVHRQIRQAQDGSCRVDFEAANDQAPPPLKGVLRIQKLSGHFLFQPQADGRVRVIHRVFTDPGGSIPTWLAEPSRKDAALAWMRHLANQI